MADSPWRRWGYQTVTQLANTERVEWGRQRRTITTDPKRRQRQEREGEKQAFRKLP
jgi:hypothetical protein